MTNLRRNSLREEEEDDDDDRGKGLLVPVDSCLLVSIAANNGLDVFVTRSHGLKTEETSHSSCQNTVFKLAFGHQLGDPSHYCFHKTIDCGFPSSRGASLSSARTGIRKGLNFNSSSEKLLQPTKIKGEKWSHLVKSRVYRKTVCIGDRMWLLKNNFASSCGVYQTDAYSWVTFYLYCQELINPFRSEKKGLLCLPLQAEVWLGTGSFPQWHHNSATLSARRPASLDPCMPL